MSTRAVRDNFSPNTIRKLFRSTLGTEKFGTSFQKIRETHPTKTSALHFTDSITCVYVQDDFLFTGTTGGAINIWNKNDLTWKTTIDRKTAVCDDNERKELETTSDIGVISLIVRNTRIFAAYEDRKIIIWDAKKNSSGYLQSQILRIPNDEKKRRGYIRCISATTPATSDSHCYLFAAYQDIVYSWKITTKKADAQNPNPIDEGQADATPLPILETAVFDSKNNPVNITSMYVHHHNLFCGFTNGVIKLWKKTETDGFQLGPEFARHHTGYIFAMKATSKLLYTAGEEGVVYLWQLSETGPIEAKSAIGVKSFAHPILSMAVCHNLIVVHQSHCIKTYLKDSLQLVQNIEIPQKVRAFTIDRSKNGGIYLGSSDCTIIQYSVTPSGHVQTIDHEASVRCIAVDTERIYSGSVDKVIRVFNKKTHAPMYVLPSDPNNRGHTRPVRCITIDDDFIYSGGEDGQVIVWSKKNHRDVKILQITDHVTIEKSDDNHRYDPNFASVTSIVVDDSYIYAGSERGFIQIWEKKSYQYQLTLLNSRNKDEVCPVRALAVYKGFLLCNYIQSINLFKLSKVNLYINMVLGAKKLKNLSFNRQHEKISLDSTISYTTGLAVYDDLIYITRSSTFDTSKTASLIAKSRDRHPGEIVILKAEDPDAEDKVLFDIDNYYSVPFRTDIVTDHYPILIPEVIELTELVKKPVKATDPHTLVVTQGRIFVACENGYIQIRDAQTGKLLIKTNLHSQWIYALSVNEGKIYTGSYDKTLKMWDYELYHYFSTLTDSQVAQNNTVKNCWITFDNKVYDLNQTEMKNSNDPKYKGLGFPNIPNWLSTKTCKDFLILVSKHTSSNKADVLVDSSGKRRSGCITNVLGTLRDSGKNTNNNNSSASYDHIISVHVAGRDITHLCTQIYGSKEGAFAALNIKEYFIGKLNGKNKKAVHYFMPDFLRKCYSEGTFADQESFEQYLIDAMANRGSDDEEPLNQRDHMDKNALMMCAISGNLKNTKLLVANGCDFSMLSKYEESALFFAMKYNRWQYLLDLKNWYEMQKQRQRSRANSIVSMSSVYPPIVIREGDLIYDTTGSAACTELLLSNARDGDVAFFKHLFECGIKFDKRMVLAEAIKYNKRRILEFWPASEWKDTFALHSACYYGRHDLIDLIVSQEGISVDECDETNAHRTALHVCHLSAKYSEYNSYELGKNRGWIAPKIYSAYEHDLIVARAKCFDEIMSAPATKVRVPDFSIFAKDGKTSYDQALNLHKYALQRRKAPQREQSDSEQILRNKSVFDSTVQSLSTFHKQEQIMNDRARFANTQFCLEAFPYLLFLILISVVGILSSTNLTSNSYTLSTAVGAHFRGDSSSMPYYSIGSESDYWNWLENTFIPAVYETAPSNISKPNFVLHNNLLLGGIRMRQLKVRNDSCRVRELYEDSIKYCYSAGYSYDNNDKMSFGPSDQYVYDENDDGDEFWNGGDFYPSGGFIQDLPVTNQSKALEIIQSLQSNGWITTGTRMVLISMTLYNANLNGAFIVLRFPAQFSAVGDVTPTNEINVMSSYSYDTDFVDGTKARITIEVLCFIYFMYAFFATEFAEMYHEYRLQDRRNKQLALLGEATEHTKKRIVLFGRAQLAYWSQYWNYYEWFMIFTFFALIVLRILTSGAFNTLNLHPQPEEFLNIHRQAFMFAYYRSLLSIFISLAWLRMLKFLRIPSSFGPIIQSIMDTLKARKVVVFMLVVVYMVVLFGLTFHLSFGYNVTAYQRWTDSMITMFQLLFQQFDYESMYDSNKVFGVIYFIGVVLLLIFLLMNLLISVLGNAYEEVETVNESKWNRIITKMMIRTLTDRASYGKQPLLREIIQRAQNIPLPSFLRAFHQKNVAWFLHIYDSVFHFPEEVGAVAYANITSLFTQNPYTMDPYKILKEEKYEIDFFVEEKISEFSGQIVHDTKEKLIMIDDEQMDSEILEQEKNSDIIEKDNFLSALVAENSEFTLSSIQEFIKTQNADANSTKELEKRIEKVENQLTAISKQNEKILKLLKK